MLQRARGEAAFFATMASSQIRALRQRRAEGSFYPALVDDLAFYLRHRRMWLHAATALAGARHDFSPPAPADHETVAATDYPPPRASAS